MIKLRKIISVYLIVVLAVLCAAACGKAGSKSDVPAPAEGDELQEEAGEDSGTRGTGGIEVTGGNGKNAADPAENPDDEDSADDSEETAEASDPGTEYDAVYAPVLQELHDVVQDGYNFEEDYDYIGSGIIEEVMYGEKEDVESVGYLMKDINRDGIPELLIGKNARYDGDRWRTYIFNGYTCIKDTVSCFLEGWVRSSYYWLGDDRFFYAGSGGAMNSMLGEAHLGDLDSLVWDDFYFTAEKEKGQTAVYHNTTGEFDQSSSEELDLTEEEFLMIREKARFELLDLIPIGSYEGAEAEIGDGSASSEDSPLVTASWEEDMSEKPRSYLVYEPEESYDYSARVFFSAKKEVKNFRLVELTMQDMGKNGEFEFQHKEYYRLDTLSPDMPLRAELVFYGDIPNNGFMYTDEAGRDHLFVVGQSGKDGSLEVWEYEKGGSGKAEEQLSADEMFEIADNLGGMICGFEYRDYDNDGTEEAFAAMGEEDEFGGYLLNAVWFIRSDGTAVKLRSDFKNLSMYPNDEGYYMEYAEEGKGFFTADCGGYGSGWLTFVFGVKDGEPYELSVSMDIQGFYQDRPGVFTTTTDDFTEGHKYLITELNYDRRTEEFQKGRVTGRDRFGE